VGICQSWQEHTHNKTNAAAMHEEGSPEAQADAQETGSFVLQYAPFVLEALARGIAGGWRTEVR
jgi:hypothetical protein